MGADIKSQHAWREFAWVQIINLNMHACSPDTRQSQIARGESLRQMPGPPVDRSPAAAAAAGRMQQRAGRNLADGQMLQRVLVQAGRSPETAAAAGRMQQQAARNPAAGRMLQRVGCCRSPRLERPAKRSKSCPGRRTFRMICQLGEIKDFGGCLARG